MENDRRTKIFPKSGRGLGHVTSTIFGSTVGYPSDSLASCYTPYNPYKLYFRRNWSAERPQVAGSPPYF